MEQNGTEVLNFFTGGGFHVKLGKLQKVIDVPLMTFESAGGVIKQIASTASKDIGAAISLLVKTKSGADVTGDAIGKAVSDMIVEKNHTAIENLLKGLSESVITDKLIKECGCQFDELVQLTTHLLDVNFKNLKNLSASLQAISMLGKN